MCNSLLGDQDNFGLLETVYYRGQNVKYDFTGVYSLAHFAAFCIDWLKTVR